MALTAMLILAVNIASVTMTLLQANAEDIYITYVLYHRKETDVDFIF